MTASRWVARKCPRCGTLVHPEPTGGDSPKLMRNATDTSSRAAEACEPREGTQRWCVLYFVRQCALWGATDEEIGHGVGLGGNSVRPRRLKLVEDGYVIDSGRRRRNQSGELAIVWVAAR